MESERSVDCAARQHQRKRDDFVYHRRGRRIFLYAVEPLYHPIDCRMDRDAECKPLGFDERSECIFADRGVLFAAGCRDFDGGTDLAADHHNSWV